MSNNHQLALAPAIEKRGIDDALWSAIKSSIFPGASEESTLLAWDYCKARGLDIMKKPCHIVPMSVKDAKTGRYETRDVIMPGIAETRITAMRTGFYAGQDPPAFGPIIEMTFNGQKHQVPESCAVTVYRMMQGEKAAFTHVEYFEEACGTTKDGSLNSMWSTRKRGQIAKCAEAGALRKAFPEELGGIITADETVNDMRDVTPRKKSIAMRDSAIDPFALPDKREPEDDHAQKSRPKERMHRRGILQKVEEKQMKDGKPFWIATFAIGEKRPELTTFSTKLGEALMVMEYGTTAKMTIVPGSKPGTFTLEDFQIAADEPKDEPLAEEEQ